MGVGGKECCGHSVGRDVGACCGRGALRRSGSRRVLRPRGTPWVGIAARAADAGTPSVGLRAYTRRARANSRAVSCYARCPPPRAPASSPHAPPRATRPRPDRARRRPRPRPRAADRARLRSRARERTIGCAVDRAACSRSIDARSGRARAFVRRRAQGDRAGGRGRSWSRRLGVLGPAPAPSVHDQSRRRKECPRPTAAHPRPRRRNGASDLRELDQGHGFSRGDPLRSRSCDAGEEWVARLVVPGVSRVIHGTFPPPVARGPEEARLLEAPA